MNKRSKETVKLNLNLRERNNTLFRSIFNEFTDENDSKVIRNLNKNTSFIKVSSNRIFKDFDLKRDFN